MAFDESLYLPHSRFAEDYNERVAYGTEVAARSTVAICGLARDLGPSLINSLEGMQAIANLFADHRMFIYENDSQDRTNYRLAEWQANDPEHRWVRSDIKHTKRWGPVRSGERGDQMAECRSKYHEAVLQLAPDLDYAIVLDMDLAGWSPTGVLSTIGTDRWDMMGANGLAVVRGTVVQYDAWAWRDVAGPTPLQANQVNHRVYDRGHPPVPVYSCFGGIAVYKMDAFKAGRYSGGDCEHVPFHTSMAEAGYCRMFCNPGLVSVYGQ